MTETVPSDVRDVVEEGLRTYGVDIDGEITVVEHDGAEYTVEVPFSGELLVDEVLANQGTLLYNKEGEIDWSGVRDGRLVLTVLLDN